MIKKLLALFGLQFKQIIIKETGSNLGILRMIFYLVWFALLGLIVGRKWDGSPKIRAEICKESYCIHCKTLTEESVEEDGITLKYMKYQ